MKIDRFVFVTLFAVAAIGCGTKPELTDDEGSKSSALSTPYARGTAVKLRVSNALADATWQIVSDNPAVFQIANVAVENGTLTAVGHALVDGETTVRVLAGGETMVTGKAVIQSANRAAVYSHGALRVGEKTESALAQAQLTAATIVVGGKASFAIGYFKDDTRLFGRGIIETLPNAALTIENDTTAGAPINEFLFVTPTIAGATTLELKQGAVVLGALPIEAVEPTALAAITIEEERGADGLNGSKVWLLANVTDKQQRPVLGVYADWLLDGRLQHGGFTLTEGPVKGDLYRFVRNNEKTATLKATVGGLEATREVHLSSGEVYDTTYLGCSAMGDLRTSAAMLLLVAGAMVLVRRRSSSANA